MLKFSAKLKEIPFELETPEGKVVKLKATEFTIEDLLKVVKLQEPIFGDEKQKKLTVRELNHVTCSRIVSSVKLQETGKYFWDIESMDEFPFNQYPKELVTELSKLVDKINTKSEDLETQKKS